jgi:hypothetical protein
MRVKVNCVYLYFCPFLNPVLSPGGTAVNPDKALAQQTVQGRKGKFGQSFTEDPVKAAAIIIGPGGKGHDWKSVPHRAEGPRLHRFNLPPPEIV